MTKAETHFDQDTDALAEYFGEYLTA